jgi:glycosyltransferase involved in cell wall biosynthesis
LAQTYQKIEIIFVDDGSTDRSGHMCDEYASVEERVKVIHTENCGLSAARNAGIEAAAGEYIVFLDSDDWVEPDIMQIACDTLGDFTKIL